ncbi:MAG: cbiJ [Clostridia bacterium]|jgi:precorrin-6A/cobalt-precorrin-6A reductase|nr:cbiJ [Clostridia bacterium]
MILVLGGTSDSLLICEQLNKANINYEISVTTEYGKTLSLGYTQNVRIGTLDLEKMKELIIKDHIDTIIDATHPYAVEASETAIQAAESLQISYVRYERKSLLESVAYDKLHVATNIEEACIQANRIGTNIFLGTGSKNLDTFWKLLPGKKLIARVLPTSKVLAICEEIGFSADTIVAVKGPFSTSVNEAHFKSYDTDLVITKESGTEGGFLEKIEACKNLGIHVIVIKRTTITYPYVVHEITDILKDIEKHYKR